MRIKGTTYRASWNDADITRAFNFLIERDENLLEIEKPLILAEREGELVGVYSLQPSVDIPIAGRLVSDSPIVAFRLAEMLDMTLFSLGVLVYYVPVDEEDKRTQELCEKAFNVAPFTTEQGCVWFERRLVQDEQQESKGAAAQSA